MTGWPSATLEEISISGGQYGANLSAYALEPGQPRYIRITDIGQYGALNPKKVGAQASKSEVDKFALREEDLLFARSGATVGKTYLHSEEHSPAIFAGYLIRFQIDQKVAYPKYIFHYCQTLEYLNWVEANSRTVAQPNINAKQYADLRIPLPPLPEQRRIAAILDHADALRIKRRESLNRLDELRQSLFVDMFGYPSRTAKAHEFVTLGELCGYDLRNGLSPSTTGSHIASVLTLSSITGDRFNGDARKLSSFHGPPPQTQAVQSRLLLICRGNGNKQLVGKGYFPTSDMLDTTFPDTIIAAAVDTSRATKSYVESVWASSLVRKQVEQGARTTNGTYKVNQSTVAEVRFFLPPLADQKVFEQICGHLDCQRTALQISAETFTNMFVSLQSRAFGGQL